MKTASALLALATLAGCATSANFERTMNSWVGASESSLVAGLGPPSNVYAAPDGDRILTYSRSSNVPIGGGTYQQPVTSTTTGNIYGTNRPISYGSTTTTYQTVQQPTYNIALSCAVHFRVVNGSVQTWRSEGNNCVAR